MHPTWINEEEEVGRGLDFRGAMFWAKRALEKPWVPAKMGGSKPGVTALWNPEAHSQVSRERVLRAEANGASSFWLLPSRMLPEGQGYKHGTSSGFRWEDF